LRAALGGASAPYLRSISAKNARLSSRNRFAFSSTRVADIQSQHGCRRPVRDRARPRLSTPSWWSRARHSSRTSFSGVAVVAFAITLPVREACVEHERQVAEEQRLESGHRRRRPARLDQPLECGELLLHVLAAVLDVFRWVGGDRWHPGPPC
jgi:hypothetical protein